jgi:hypothetical protein
MTKSNTIQINNSYPRIYRGNKKMDGYLESCREYAYIRDR